MRLMFFFYGLRRQKKKKKSREEENSPGLRDLSPKPSGVTGIVLPSIQRPSSEISVSGLRPLAARGGCFPWQY